MPLSHTVPADGLRDPSAIPAYLRAFHRYLDAKGMRVEQIRLPAFLAHHDRCEYEAFRGWSSDCLFWGIWHGEDMVASWAAKPYMLMPGETLRQMMETRGLYDTMDEAWRLDGAAFDHAEQVTEMAVFEGGLCTPKHLRETPLIDFVVREMPLFARASAVGFWSAPWVWYLAKKPNLARRFGPQFLAEPVIWTKGGERKDDAIRWLGLSSAPWIERMAARWSVPAR